MANPEHLSLLKRGVEDWNVWKKESIKIKPTAVIPGIEPNKADLRRWQLLNPEDNVVDLCNANLSGMNLSRADLRWVDLRNANLNGAFLQRANISEANLSGATLIKANLLEANLWDSDLTCTCITKACLAEAHFYGANLSNAYLDESDLRWANLSEANLSNAHLRKAFLRWANFARANLTGADLSGADLIGSQLIETNLQDANITGCLVFGVSAWGINLIGAEQKNLIITPKSLLTNCNEPTITVDNLELAQFIYLLLNNERVRSIIDTITSKVVLILGRFTDNRKVILDGLRDALRVRNYLPVIFDWDKPISRDFIETVSTLAHLARFIIADVTDPKIILEEIPHIVRNIAVPVKPLMLKDAGEEPVTLYSLRINHRTVLDTYHYKDLADLLLFLDKEIISPTELKCKELLEIRLE